MFWFVDLDTTQMGDPEKRGLYFLQSPGVHHRTGVASALSDWELPENGEGRGDKAGLCLHLSAQSLASVFAFIFAYTSQ